MGWENVTATGYVPPAIPFAVDWKLEIENVQGPGTEDAIGTPASAAEALARWRQAGDSIVGDVASGDPGETVTITPADPRALTTSEVLPPSVWQDTPSIGEDNVAGAAGASVAATGDVLAAIGTGHGGDATQAANPWFFFPPFMTLGFMRYNPVEGVSTGTQLRRDFGWWRSALSMRIATRSLAVPDIDFTLQRTVRFLQISVFGDWASVEDADFCAVGAGLVFLDGLLRFDLARGVRCGRPGPSEAGWRFHPRGFTFF